MSYETYCAVVGLLFFVLFVVILFGGAPLEVVLLAFGSSGFCFFAMMDQ